MNSRRIVASARSAAASVLLIAVYATVAAPSFGQIGPGNQRGLDLATGLPSVAAGAAAKVISPGNVLDVIGSASNSALVGAPFFLAADLRFRSDQNVLQLPLEPDVLGVGLGFFWVVGNLGPIPPVFPGSYPLGASPLTFSAPLPDWSSLGDRSLHFQAVTLDPTAPHGLAISRTIRHDLVPTPVETVLTDSGYSSQNYLSYGLHTADMNGDGYLDVLVGKPGASPLGLLEAGELHIAFGPDQVTTSTLLSLLPSAGAWFGSSVRSADRNNDGVTVLIVGAREETVSGFTGAGAVYLLDGPSFGNKTRIVSPNPEPGARFGNAVAHTDWNGDGLMDLVVGAPKSTSSGFVQAGRVFIYLAPNFGAPLVIECPNPAFGSKFGYALEGGDLDGDGLGDLAVGAPFHDVLPNDDTGAAYLFRAPSLTPWISHLQPAGHAVLGNAVTIVDFDLDGHLDVAFGAEFDANSGVADAGSVHILMGPSFLPAREIFAPTPQVFGGFGSDVAHADVNGDGFPDLVVGEFWYQVGSVPRSGRGWVVYGPTLEQFTELMPAVPDNDGSRGRRVAAGDLDGDGFAEAILGSPFSSPPGNPGDGEAHIFRVFQ